MSTADPPAREPGPAHGRRAELLLALGAAAGLGIAMLRIFEPAAPVPEGVVATVNGEPIRAELYHQAVAGLAADRRTPLDEDDRRHVLDRLIEEELLVQRALALGLVRHERKIRGELVGAVIESVVADASLADPSPGDLESFYDEHQDYFRRPGRLRVSEVRLRRRPGETEPMAAERAQRVAARLRAGDDAMTVARELGDPVVATVPDTLLPPGKLGEYLGSAALRSAQALAPGEVSDPLPTPQGLQVLRLEELEPEVTPRLEEVRSHVLVEWRRRSGDIALRRYLDDLRGRADLRVTETLD